MGPHEPYWRTNTSFSPPPSTWDFRFESERLPDLSSNVVQWHGSSTSSNSKESRSWVRGDLFPNCQYSTSDGVGPYFSSPSDISPVPQTPPAIQGFGIDDYEIEAARKDSASGPYYAPTMEGTSSIVDSGGSTSSHSDGSECEPIAKLHSFSHRNISNRRSFMSKPIHPLSFPTQTMTREPCDAPLTGFSEIEVATPQRDTHRWSSASSGIDYTDDFEPLDSEISDQSSYSSKPFKCGLCERFLSQRSPWSSHRIVRSGDMPISGVLSCRHVFHAECLDQTTPKMRKSDPPCPLCARLEDNSSELRPLSRLKSGIPRLRPFCEHADSEPWEGALQAPSRNTMSLLNRNRIKRNLSLKGNSSKDYPGKLKKIGSHSSQVLAGWSVDQTAVGCSKSEQGLI